MKNINGSYTPTVKTPQVGTLENVKFLPGKGAGLQDKN